VGGPSIGKTNNQLRDERSDSKVRFLKPVKVYSKTIIRTRKNDSYQTDLKVSQLNHTLLKVTI
jgi:hypothetical protein